MSPALIGIDLAAISILTFGIYLPRHRRRDLLLSFLGVNVGVLAVATALSGTTVGAGLGLGLFGVLSIIRLRSEELSQTEVAYYFAALALGLLGGLGASNVPVIAGLMGLLLVVFAVGDSPLIARPSRRQDLILDRAHLSVSAARAHVERLLGVEVIDLTITRTDLVNDTTAVEIRVTASERAESPTAVASR